MKKERKILETTAAPKNVNHISSLTGFISHIHEHWENIENNEFNFY